MNQRARKIGVAIGVYRESYSAPSWLRMHRLDLECFRRLITAAAAALNRTGAVKKEKTRSFPFMDGYRDRSAAIPALEEILRVCHRFWCSLVYLVARDFKRTTYKYLLGVPSLQSLTCDTNFVLDKKSSNILE